MFFLQNIGNICYISLHHVYSILTTVCEDEEVDAEYK